MKQLIAAVVVMVGAGLATNDIALAQSSNAALTVTVTDPQNLVVPDADVALVHTATKVTRRTSSSATGIALFGVVPAGIYQLIVHRDGFATTEVDGVVLNASDQGAVRVQLTVAELGTSVTVSARDVLVNESPAAATVIDRQFVENQPLNGRSFQTLIGLSPGVVPTAANVVTQGQFSVNGQRPSTNNFSVDGVSANFGLGPSQSLYEGAGGGVPSMSAQGGTSSLVSVDAVEEFVIQTSTYAPEFGRQPGAQVSIVTRSGTNQYSGTAFNYFRNGALDANDFFANANGVTQPAMRQNDFGFTLGGPVVAPEQLAGSLAYDGRNRTFFFASYEGLRLVQPVISNPLRVPSLAARQRATGIVRDLVNAWPLPTGPAFENAPDEAPYRGGFSNPSRLDAASIRVDHRFANSQSIFGRYNHAPSENRVRAAFEAASTIARQPFETRTLTLGTTQVLSPRAVNDFRINASHGRSGQFYSMDDFGGAIVPPTSTMFPSFTDASEGRFGVGIGGSGNALLIGKLSDNRVNQFNVVDTLSWTAGTHSLKLGVDYRRLTSTNDIGLFARNLNPGSVAQLMTAVIPSATVTSYDLITKPVYQNLSLFLQDTWRTTQRLTLTYGLRYDVNPAPFEANGHQPLTVLNVDDLAQLKLASAGTRPFDTVWSNIAPRVGAAYVLSPSRNTMLRGGFGVYYDLGYTFTSQAFIPANYPFGRQAIILNQPIDSPLLSAPPPAPSSNPPYPQLFAYTPGFTAPYSLQYNATVEQPIGANMLSVAYVGSAGFRLARLESLRNPTPEFTRIDLVSNGASARYNSLQLQFQRRLSRGLQALASYTLSESIDTVSDDSLVNFQISTLRYDPEQDRGPSSFDVRHLFNVAVSYDIPAPVVSGPAGALLGGFGLDFIYRARSGTPVNIVTGQDFLGVGLTNVSRPDVVPGQPFYLDDSSAPGGRVFNRLAFETTGPQRERRQGTLGRNVLRGVGASQLDVSVRRRFALAGRTTLQFRLDVFNLFNQANFANPIGILTDPNFGRSTQMLNTGLRGLNALYQIGGPRSLQASLKIGF